MVRYMKCVKTGCDIICDNQIYHGDLFYHDGVLILSGVPKEIFEDCNYCVSALEFGGKPVFYHFKARNLFEIPCGYDFKCYMVKDVFDVQEIFMGQIKTYEPEECIKLFENK